MDHAVLGFITIVSLEWFLCYFGSISRSDDATVKTTKVVFGLVWLLLAVYSLVYGYALFLKGL